ncbi:hypothetical protein IMZ48_20375 [Candidatus Bathyarchaeota archaeon]|nr:hypothetical protein [Candidatus Bathyarchaeota archaeon]
MATGIMKESNDTILRKDIDEEKRQKRGIRDAWIGVVKGGLGKTRALQMGTGFVSV